MCLHGMVTTNPLSAKTTTTTQCMPKMLTWKFNDDIRLFILCVWEYKRSTMAHVSMTFNSIIFYEWYEYIDIMLEREKWRQNVP